MGSLGTSGNGAAEPGGSANDHGARNLTLAATVVGSSLAFLDATVVIVALPQISEDLNLGLTGQQWVYLAYSLTLASLYLVAGAVGDRWGRRDTFVYGAVGFAAASALAGFAPNEVVLIIARALQGVGGAFLTTNSLALLRSTFGSESGRAIGLWTSFTAVATIAGPPLGGALVEWVSWRWIFFINLPLAAVTVLLARAGRCQERAQVRVGRLDIPGAATAALGLGMITYALVEGADQGFGKVWWALAVGALSLAGFVLVERRAEEPLLPFRLFRRRNFAAANAETFLVYAAIGSIFVYLTLYLQFLGFTPFQAGLALAPVSVVTIVLAPRFGRLADRNGPRLYLALGPVLIGAGALLFAFMETKGDVWSLGVLGLALFSLGLSVARRADHSNRPLLGAAGCRGCRLRRELDHLAARQPPRGGHHRPHRVSRLPAKRRGLQRGPTRARADEHRDRASVQRCLSWGHDRHGRACVHGSRRCCPLDLQRRRTSSGGGAPRAARSRSCRPEDELLIPAVRSQT